MFEVVPDDLFVFLPAIAGSFFEPTAEPLMEFCAQLLRDRLIRGVEDEQMAEAIARSTEAAARRADQLLAHERAQRISHSGTQDFGHQVDDRSLIEDLPDDRGPLDHCALDGVKLV